jgi:sec-independent protein translocase protein TatA
MGGVSIWHWIVVGVIVMLLFGRGKISEMMGDVAKGIKAFKKGMTEEETAATANPTTAPGEPARTIEHQPGAPAQPTATTAGAPLGERKVG